ncbi:TonB-dependent receptor domain-containing protein [Amaricoccus tamworthensis]|uniref:TonB-dependent receptor domain-containing protein n=1 Tax=Amaricoccus tamworthensis TaxID=57002 RepID=UPI003C7D0391
MAYSRKAALLASAAVFCAHAAAAQESFVLDPIRVEAEDAQTTLGNTMIDRETIEAANPSSMADVFVGQSEIISSGGAAIAQKVLVHGIEESLLSVTIDGARQNKSAFHHTGNVLMDPTLLKQVEVSSGIAPADAGPGALAGVIAYETMDARDLLLPGQEFGGQATLSYGDNGNSLRSALTLFGSNSGFEYLLSGTRLTGDDYEDGSGNVVPGTEPDLTSLIGKFAFTTETGKRLEFSADETKDTGDRAMQLGPGGLYYARPDFAGVVGRDSVYLPAESKRTSYTFTYTDEQPTGIFAPTIQLSYNEQYVEAGAAIGTNASLSGKIENEFYIGSGALTAGADFFHDTATPESPLTTPEEKETLDSVGIYAQMRQDVGARLSLSYGARVDHQTFELASGDDYSDTGISVNAQADYILTDSLTFNIGGASSFGGYELSEASLINLGGAWVYGDPETSRANNARMGLRYEYGAWTASGALFYTEILDVNDVLTAAREKSDVTSQGIDASLTYNTTRAFAQVNYTYADVEMDGETIGTTAYYYGRPVGHIIGVLAGYEVTPEITIGGSAEFALKNDDTENAALGTEALDAYEVVNLYAAYVPQRFENVEFRVDARNLFDETYVARGADGTGLANVVPLNEPGRSLFVTASLKF